MPVRVKGVLALVLFIVCFAFAFSMKPNKIDPDAVTSTSMAISAPVDQVVVPPPTDPAVSVPPAVVDPAAAPTP